MCLVHEFLLGSPAGISEVPIRIAHHPLGAVIVVLDGDVDRHLRSLPHDLSVSLCLGGVNGRWSLLAPAKRSLSHACASASASSPASSRISGTSARLTPRFSNASTISMPKALCPAATGTAAKDL